MYESWSLSRESGFGVQDKLTRFTSRLIKGTGTAQQNMLARHENQFLELEQYIAARDNVRLKFSS